MKQKSSRVKSSRKTEENGPVQAVSGERTVSLSPPDYGIEFVDQPPKEAAVPGTFSTPLKTSAAPPVDPVQRKGSTPEENGRTPKTVPRNNTGLPDNLKAGLESLSGMAMDDVNVHYNSPKPAQLQALAYTQGTDIHVASGQERHLPHEAWHVVQQKQGRVGPTRQMKGGVNLNDDAGLEKEAEVMGNKAVQMVYKGGQKPAVPERYTPQAKQPLQKKVFQRNGDGIQYLRIGIIGPGQDIATYANQLPANTNVWILTNRAVETRDSDLTEVTTGQNRSSPNEIIRANEDNVKAQKKFDESRSGGKVTSRFFQSGEFVIPRQSLPSNRNEVDYSFLRFAALQSYALWHASTGAALGWPSLTASTTIVESIDSDQGGIHGSTSEVEKEDSGEVKSGWLAQAGVYSWDWTEVKDNERVKAPFSEEEVVDTGKRDTALKKFSSEYDEAEIEAREDAKSRDIFMIYFPEPATRLSSAALDLLNDDVLGNLSVTAGQQLGHKRESIGLIAGLVALDKIATGASTSRSKSKLKFNPSYKVKTGLGNRKDDYIGIFLEWYREAEEEDGGFKDVSFAELNSARGFDQSYLNPNVPGNIQDWHNNTLTAMDREPEKIGKFFFNPR